ncbi:hypothetical protein J6I39_03845 [bacterium]|nr:hypothetical protein [bacterium]
MSDKLKQLTGKNPKDFEPVAYSLINTPDVDLFKELVERDDYLFDFVKNNVANRLKKNCNKDNYLNLLQLLKFYSPSYEDFIVSTLVKFANDDLTDTMLEVLNSGSDDEKTYCAKYFEYINDPLALDLIKRYAISENQALSTNCIYALRAFGDKELFNLALEKLKSNDEYEQLSGAKFLVSYGDKSCTQEIVNAVKCSPLAENIASELPYLLPLHELNHNDKLVILNNIINGLGEVSSLSQVFDFELYSVFDEIINANLTPQTAVVLLNAIDKFDTLTENDEYLFDESKEAKQEIFDIKVLLSSLNLSELKAMASEELRQDSLFVFTALEHASNIKKVRNLLACDNQTLILKTVEVLKKLGALTSQDKNLALENITDENITNIILAI